MSAHKLGSIQKKNERIDNPQIQEIINKIEQLSDRIKQPSINTSHIITFNDDTAKVILPIKICEGCEMALVEFKSSENEFEELYTFLQVMLKILFSIMKNPNTFFLSITMVGK